jgi:hypothetical protein
MSLVDVIREELRKQIEDTWKAGKPVIAVKDGKRVYVYPDGHIEDA